MRALNSEASLPINLPFGGRGLAVREKLPSRPSAPHDKSSQLHQGLQLYTELCAPGAILQGLRDWSLESLVVPVIRFPWTCQRVAPGLDSDSSCFESWQADTQVHLCPTLHDQARHPVVGGGLDLPFLSLRFGERPLGAWTQSAGCVACRSAPWG